MFGRLGEKPHLIFIQVGIRLSPQKAGEDAPPQTDQQWVPLRNEGREWDWRLSSRQASAFSIFLKSKDCSCDLNN